jgi:hypothetical protein
VGDAGVGSRALLGVAGEEGGYLRSLRLIGLEVEGAQAIEPGIAGICGVGVGVVGVWLALSGHLEPLE